MLGTQRTTVTEAAVRLQDEGLIKYSRGRVDLTNVEGLEARACECRRAVAESRNRLQRVAVAV